MALAFAAAAVLLLVLAADRFMPRLQGKGQDLLLKARRSERRPVLYDPGRERRAEQRARALLRSCVNQEEWEMYRELGFIRIWAQTRPTRGRLQPDEQCAYLLYPHLPIVAYLPKTRRLLGEYCITFEDPSRPYGSGRLPAADDVLAKWMALTGDEWGVISLANMHLPGRQCDPQRIRRDLVRLEQWERARMPAPPDRAALKAS
jgi:hypothetical protein